MKRVLIFLCLLLLLTGCAFNRELPREENISVSGNADLSLQEDHPAQPPEEVSPVLTAPDEPVSPPDPRQETVNALLSAMTTEEKVGQMFFVRCPTANQAELIGNYHLGGLLLFLRDFQDSAQSWLTAEQFTEKITSYQESSASIPLLIGVDEEGGTVARATRNPNLFSNKRKSPQTIFKNGGISAIVQDTLDVNSGLLDYGINVNFAPVADVSTDPTSFIYGRTLGQDAEATAAYIDAAVTAMERAGIGSVLKHFPGYGDNVDTHTGIAMDDRPYEWFVHGDFLPFQAGVAAGGDSVLVSHNIVACMDDTLPASLSPEVHRVLREELNFTGVVLTDDLAMDAVEAFAKDGSVAVLAVLAGNDMIVTTDFETQIPAVIAAVEDGRIPMDMIDSAVSRILAWKYDLGLLLSADTGE